MIAFPDGTWIDEVSTAGGGVLLYDHNGETVHIDPRTAVRYPNRPPHIKRVEIQPSPASEWQPAAAPVDKKPGEASSVMRKVDCDPTVDQVKIKYHRERETGGSGYECFTGEGIIDLEKGTWIDEVYVGNGDILLYDANGDTVPLKSRTSIRYPNRPPHITKLEILSADNNWVSAIVPWTSSAW
nr:hypothetical protein [Kibdelosporangium sp. MJ126-NF4]